MSPDAVAPAWTQDTLQTSPDLVIALDVAAIRNDRFFGPVLAHEAADHDERALFAQTSRLDIFATASERWLAVLYDPGPSPWPLVQRRWPRGGTPTAAGLLFAPADRGDDVWLSVRPHQWVLASSRPDDRATPNPVDIDSGAVMEAWIGPKGIAAVLSRAHRPARGLYGLQSARVRIEGGNTPGVVLDATFVSSDAAAEAELDVTRQERELEAMGPSSELARQVLALLGQVQVGRSGATLHIGFHTTPALRDYLLARALEDRR